MSTNRPFLANFLAAFRAPAYKASSQTSSSLGSAQIAQSARAIATKAGSSSSPTSSSNNQTSSSSSSPSSATANHQNQSSANHHHYHHHHHHHHASTESSALATSTSQPPSTSSSSATPIPISRTSGADRQRRGSDSSSGSGGFRDALGPEKWYIGGRTPAGEERFYRLGMVTKGGGRLGGSGRVGSIDQLSL
ncbi:hypothetical protein N7510_009875 [Penicillium lagena]|uniref:uncharacterized protein n=1 Tax=Penicillium lagena TaxID=94218 RepID=UPI00254050FD|nr:uncharacterized protein N7510_009875 [Penicillium lagena]KAJ5604721.1 hypothetical protein N7510_009875 [Penicillium lagena]